MTNRASTVAVPTLLALTAILAGCSTPTAHTPSASTTAAPPTSATSTTTTTANTTPSGPPVGTATMQMLGTGSGPVTIRYQINGGPEQVDNNVTLPWSKDYPVYNELSSSVTAEGAGQNVLTCSIIMDGKLLAFRSEPNATCAFAYWG